MAGVFVGVTGDAQQGAAAIITGSDPSLPELPAHGKCAPLLSPATNVKLEGGYIAGTLSIVDAGFECRGCGTTRRTAVAGTRNTYLRRATVVGFTTIVSAHSPTNANETLYMLPTKAAGTRVHELSVALPSRPGKINGTAYIDGRALQTMTPIVNVSSLTASEVAAHSFDAVCDRLSWGALLSPLLGSMLGYVRSMFRLNIGFSSSR